LFAIHFLTASLIAYYYMALIVNKLVTASTNFSFEMNVFST